jgi:type IV pilus assembly protein PilE
MPKYRKYYRGVTLIELMVTVAIISVIASIAIPLYNEYVREARITTARANIEPLRLALEDYWLDNDTYITGTWNPSGTKSLENGNLGWKPDGDEDQFIYTVTAATNGSITNSYTISVQHIALTSNDAQTLTKTP